MKTHPQPTAYVFECHDTIRGLLQELKATAATRDRLHAENAQLVAALKEIVVICTESRGDLRRRMGTRVGNILVSAKSALASQEQARSAIARAKGKDGAK
mgnify:CR=1 FL=1